MATTWQEDFFEKLVEASQHDDARLATGKVHRRKKTASFQHSQLRSVECSFDSDRIGGSNNKQVLVIECSPKRGSEFDAPALRREFQDAHLTGELAFVDGVLMLQYQWGTQPNVPLAVHNPQQVRRLTDWTHGVLRLVFDHLEQRHRVLLPARSSNDSASSGTEYVAALEQYLEDFIVDGWESLGWVEDLEYLDRQMTCGDIGDLDIVARDRTTGDFVVIELKRDRPERQVVGQLTSYMDWIAEHKSHEAGVGVRGVIIAYEITDKLRSAVRPVPNVELYEYRFAVNLNHVELERPTRTK